MKMNAGIALLVLAVESHAGQWQPQLTDLLHDGQLMLPPHLLVESDEWSESHKLLATPMPKPQVAPQWSATLVLKGSQIGMQTNGTGTFYYDRTGQRYRQTVWSTTNTFRPNHSILQDQLHENVSGRNFNMTVGDVCLGSPFATMPYSDFFAWIAYATETGQKVVGGETCTLYEASASSGAFPMKVRNVACIAADGVPREMSQVFESIKFSGGTTYIFSDVVVGSPGDAAFAVSKPCATNYPTQPCADPEVTTLDVYRIFGPPEPSELGGRDAGDVLGDLSFLCTQASGEAYRTKLITHWSVQVSKAFGQYALCNFNGTDNVCAGPPQMLRHVGRRSSQMQGDGPLSGQCSPNEDVGSQYSFPTQAMCPPGILPSSGTCAWGGARAVRTVSAHCVIEERGLLEVCAKEFGHAPFVKSAKVFKAAVDSSNPEEGGCPDVLPSSIVLV